MSKKKPNSKSTLPPLSDSQLEIMNDVWDHKEATVGEIWKQIALSRKVSRNTIQTLVIRLRDKGWLRERIDGTVHWYRASRKRNGTQRQMVRKLLDNAFAGSAEGLVMALLDSRPLSKEEAARIRKMIDDSEA